MILRMYIWHFEPFSALPWVLLALAVLVPAIWLMATYNSLVRLKQYVRESWSGIDTELKRRYDLIPNLVETVKGYAAHRAGHAGAGCPGPRGAVASTGSPPAQAKDENVLVGSLRQLLAVAENYPQLKANENFLALQTELANTEDRIQAARRFYNANVRDLNTRVGVFPSNLIAGMFHFQPAELSRSTRPSAAPPAPRVSL